MTNLNSEEQSYFEQKQLEGFIAGEVGKDDIPGSETISYLPAVNAPGTDQKTIDEFFLKFPRWQKKYDWQDASGTGKHFVQMLPNPEKWKPVEKPEPSELTFAPKPKTEFTLIPKPKPTEFKPIPKSSLGQ